MGNSQSWGFVFLVFAMSSLQLENQVRLEDKKNVFLQNSGCEIKREVLDESYDIFLVSVFFNKTKLRYQSQPNLVQTKFYFCLSCFIWDTGKYLWISAGEKET